MRGHDARIHSLRKKRVSVDGSAGQAPRERQRGTNRRVHLQLQDDAIFRPEVPLGAVVRIKLDIPHRARSVRRLAHIAAALMPVSETGAIGRAGRSMAKRTGLRRSESRKTLNLIGRRFNVPEWTSDTQ